MIRNHPLLGRLPPHERRPRHHHHHPDKNSPTHSASPSMQTSPRKPTPHTKRCWQLCFPSLGTPGEGRERVHRAPFVTPVLNVLNPCLEMPPENPPSF